MNDKDYSLLRPFDVNAAKRGEMLCWYGNAQTAKYLAGPDAHKTVAIEWAEENQRVQVGQLEVVNQACLRMAPLCWVEGKPVYEGDVLWHTSLVKVTAAHGRKDNVKGFVCTDGDYVSANNLSWTPPKVKREGWVNIYPAPPGSRMLANTSHVYPTAKSAAEGGSDLRIDCVRIEWEEPVK